MDLKDKPYAHVSVDAVDIVVHDPEGHYDPERYDHYPSFEQARDAALSCVELLLDEGDYDGPDHRDELERMRELLEGAASYDELVAQPAYGWFADRLRPVGVAA
jgi:hypothetical protein